MLDALDRLFTDARMEKLGATLAIGALWAALSWVATDQLGGTLTPISTGLVACAAYSAGRRGSPKGGRKDA